MPLCFCTSFGCSSLGGLDPITGKPRGIKQDSRTFKTHSLKDKREAFHAAEQKIEEAVEDEIEEISAYLAASVLADKVSGPPENPAGSLWSRDNSFSSESKATPDIQSSSRPHHPHHALAGSRRSREAQILSCLSDIEVEVNSLHSESKMSLNHLGLPSAGGPTPFPLLNLLDVSSSLKSQLDGIKFKSPAVLELKDTISRKLLLNEKNLTDAKKQWTRTLSDIKTINTPIHGTPYETCTFLNNHFCITIFIFMSSSSFQTDS